MWSVWTRATRCWRRRPGKVEGHDNVEFQQADATSLPLEDASFDRALSVQVMEYVQDIPGALAELHRVLKPGGRVLIWDVDWATTSWHSEDPARMRRMLEAWDKHLIHPSLPSTLAAQLRAAGFEGVEMTGHAFATTELSPEIATAGSSPCCSAGTWSSAAGCRRTR